MIRTATEADVPAILGMIRALAEYEREPEAATATVEQLTEALFGPAPAVFCHLAVDDDGAGVVGMALWFRNFSTWTGTHGVYLEDLFVRPEARGAGHGKALLAALARVCVDHGYRRFEWSVLDWNSPAIGFYRSIGAVGMDGWTVQRLTGDALAALAAE